MKYKPKNRDELEELIYDENIYLGDIDTSLVDVCQMIYSRVEMTLRVFQTGMFIM